MTDGSTSGMRTPRCPTCAEALNRRFGDFAAWECPGAHGMATTLPVARQQVHPSSVATVWRHSAEAEPGARGCPFCTRPMVVVEVSVSATVPPVRLDVCRVDQLIWFDPGEIAVLPAAPAGTAEVESDFPIIVSHWANVTDEVRDATDDWLGRALIRRIPPRFG